MYLSFLLRSDFMAVRKIPLKRRIPFTETEHGNDHFPSSEELKKSNDIAVEVTLKKIREFVLKDRDLNDKVSLVFAVV